MSDVPVESKCLFWQQYHIDGDVEVLAPMSLPKGGLCALRRVKPTVGIREEEGRPRRMAEVRGEAGEHVHRSWGKMGSRDGVGGLSVCRAPLR